MSAMAAMALGGAGCVAAGGALAFLTRLGIALFAQAVGIVLLGVAGLRCSSMARQSGRVS